MDSNIESTDFAEEDSSTAARLIEEGMSYSEAMDELRRRKASKAISSASERMKAGKPPSTEPIAGKQVADLIESGMSYSEAVERAGPTTIDLTKPAGGRIREKAVGLYRAGKTVLKKKLSPEAIIEAIEKGKISIAREGSKAVNAALEGVSDATGSSFMGSDVVSPGSMDLVRRAASELGVELTPKAIEYVAKLPFPIASLEGATYTANEAARPTTDVPMGDIFRELTGEELTKEGFPQAVEKAYMYDLFPKLTTGKEWAIKKLEFDEGDFDSRSKMQQFALQAARLGAGAGKFAISVIPSRAGEVAITFGPAATVSGFSLLRGGLLNQSGAVKLAAAMRESAKNRLAIERSLKVPMQSTRYAEEELLARIKDYIRATKNVAEEKAAAEELVSKEFKIVKKIREEIPKEGESFILPEDMRQVDEPVGGMTPVDILEAQLRQQPNLPLPEVERMVRKGLPEAMAILRSWMTPSHPKVKALVEKSMRAMGKVLPSNKIGEAERTASELGLTLEDTNKMLNLVKSGKMTVQDTFAGLFREPRARLRGSGKYGAEYVDLLEGMNKEYEELAAPIVEKIRLVMGKIKDENVRFAVGKYLSQEMGRKSISKGFSNKQRRQIVESADEISKSFNRLTRKMDDSMAPEFRVPETGEFNSDVYNPGNVFFRMYDFRDPRIEFIAENRILKDFTKHPEKASLYLDTPGTPDLDDLKIASRNKFYQTRVDLRSGMIEHPEKIAEFRELDIPGYSKDVQAVMEHTAKAWAYRAMRYKHLGKDDANAHKLINKMSLAGYSRAYPETVLKLLTDGILIAHPLAANVSRTILAAEVIMKMGRSAVRQLGQLAAAAGYGGVFGGPAMVKSIYQYAKTHGKSRLFRALDAMIDTPIRSNVAGAAGVSVDSLTGDKLFSKWVTPEQFLKFNKTIAMDKLSRMIAGGVGSSQSEWAAGMIKKFGKDSLIGRWNKGLLKYYGFDDADIAKIASSGKLTFKQTKEIAYKYANRTMHNVGPLDIPISWQKSGIEDLFQFASMPFRTGKLMLHVLKSAPLVDKMHIIPMTMAYAMVFGIPTNTVIDFFTGKSVEKLSAVRHAKVAKRVGGLIGAAVQEEGLLKGIPSGISYLTEKDRHDILGLIVSNITGTIGMSYMYDAINAAFPGLTAGMELETHPGAVPFGPAIGDANRIATVVNRIVTKPGYRKGRPAPKRTTEEEVRAAARVIGPMALSLGTAATGNIPATVIASALAPAIFRSIAPQREPGKVSREIPAIREAVEKIIGAVSSGPISSEMLKGAGQIASLPGKAIMLGGSAVRRVLPSKKIKIQAPGAER